MRQILFVPLASCWLVSALMTADVRAQTPQQDPDEDTNIVAKACTAPDSAFEHKTDKKQHPTPAPEPDKALIYVVRPTGYGGAIQTKLSVDGVWKGVNRGKNYFFFALDPGSHYFCSRAENRSALALSVEAGKIYYIQQKIRAGFMKARNKLEVIHEQEGQKALKRTKLSVWKEKA